MKLGAFGYVVATGLQAVGSFVFLSLAVRLVGAPGYGHWALLEPLLLLGGLVATFGLTTGVIKLIAQDGHERRQVLHAVSGRALLASIAVAAPLALGLTFWLDLGVFGGVVFAILLAESRYQLQLNTLRGSTESGRYAALVGCRVTSSVVALLALWRLQGAGDHDWRLLSLVWLGSILVALALDALLQLRRRQAAPARLPDAAAAYGAGVRYGLPLLGASVLTALLANSDRYILATQATPADIAAYVLAAKVAAVLNLCVTPLNLWWPATRFVHVKDADQGRHFFSRTALILCGVLAAAAALIYVMGPTLLRVFAPLSTFDPVVTGLLCLSAFFVAFAVPLNVGTLNTGRTHWAPVVTAIAAGLQIVLGLILVPHFGALGVAVAAVIGSLCNLALQATVSQKLHPVPHRFFHMTAIVLAWGLIAALVTRTDAPAAAKFGLVALMGACQVLVFAPAVMAQLVRRLRPRQTVD